MSDLGTIFGSKLATSFKVGNLYVTANSLSQTMVSYCDPALFHFEGWEDSNFFVSGSSFRFSFGNRYYAIITAHQMTMHSAEPEQFAILSQQMGTLVTSSRMVFAEEEDFDLRLFEFTESYKKGALANICWWKAMQNELFQPTPAALKVFCVGYPGASNFIDFEYKELKARPYCVWGEMSEPHLANRLSFTPTEQPDQEPSGMSGSPVFGIKIVHNEPVCFWAGILTNASPKAYNFIPATRIGSMLSYAPE